MVASTNRRTLRLTTLSLLSLLYPLDVASTGDEYRLGARDEISIRVEELPSLEELYTIAEDGILRIPRFGSLTALGLTTHELEIELARKLESQGLRRASVTVAIREYRSRPVTVLGAIEKPGNHYVARRTSLLRVLLDDAGGIAKNHNGTVQVRRTGATGISDVIEITAQDLLDRADPRTDIPIFAGDLINLPETESMTVHFLGEVGSPGSVTFPDANNVTLLTAVSKVGGLSEEASNKIRIRRLVTNTERREIVCHFRRILNGDDDDIALQDGDIIVVKQSFL